MKRAASAVLISETDIQRRVSEMGAQISRDYKGGSLIVVGILKGSFIFIADLIRSIDDSILLEVEFMTASSYGAVHVFDLTDGKISRFREYTDLDTVLS